MTDTDLIILTDTLAPKISGKYGKYSFLDPYLVTKEGVIKYALPIAVLADKEYRDAWEVLKAVPQEEGWSPIVEEQPSNN